MIGVLLFLTLIVFVYLIGFVIKFGVPESLSATYYSLGKYGWIFQVCIFLVGVLLLPVWLSLSEEAYQSLVFLACASLCFVASAPCFKLELQGRCIIRRLSSAAFPHLLGRYLKGCGMSCCGSFGLAGCSL